MTATIHALYAPSIHDRAIRVALSAENDWGVQLAAARTLATSPDWTHQNLARHIRRAHALHLAHEADKARVAAALSALPPAPAMPSGPSRKGTIRSALVDCAGLAVIIAVAFAAYLAGP